MNKTALILGATGKSGRRLAPMLEARGMDVRRASRSASGAAHFDWDDAGTYAPALQGVTAVYLVVADPGIDPTAQVEPFLHEARRAGVGRIVAVSSLGVTFSDEPADSPRLKLERLLAESGTDWTILRPSGFNQNFSEGFLLPGILAGAVATATGRGQVGFVDAEDIATVAAVALTEPGHAGQHYAVTGPEALSFEQATAVIADVTQRPIAYHGLSPQQFAGILQGAGVPPDSATIVVRDQVAIGMGEGAVISDVVPRLIGQPAKSFRAYAEATAMTWRR